MDVGCSLWRCGASTITWQHYLDSALLPNSLKSIPDLHRQNSNSVNVDPDAHPQHIKVQKHIGYMVWMWDVVYKGLGASTITLQYITASHGLSPAPRFPNSTPDLHRHNNIQMGLQYAHPQHIKVLKHFLYIWNGCGMQFLWGFGALNMKLQHHFGLSPAP